MQHAGPLTPAERRDYELGRRCFERGDAETSLPHLTRLIRTRNFADVHYMIGMMHERQGDLSAASQSLREALRINSSYTEALLALANVYENQGDFDRSREIAERAGVSEGALYRHYASKEELACSIFVTHLQQLTEELASAIAGAPDYRAKIRAFVETCLAAYEEDSKLFTYLIVSEYREFRTLPEGTRHPGHLAMEMIARGQEAGVLRPLEVHVAGSILVGSLVRICAAKMYGGVRNDLRTLAAGMADSLWDALKRE